MTSGLLDTSVVVDWHDPSVVRALPDEMAISAITVAELAAGPHLASTLGEAAKRQTRLQEVEAKFEPILFDGSAARSYGLVVAAVVRQGRKPRSRIAALRLAATAHAHRLGPYPTHAESFRGSATRDPALHIPCPCRGGRGNRRGWSWGFMVGRGRRGTPGPGAGTPGCSRIRATPSCCPTRVCPPATASTWFAAVGAPGVRSRTTI